MRQLHRVLAALALASTIAFALPAHAGLLSGLNINKLTKGTSASPPPEHRTDGGWDSTGQPEWVTTRPAMTGIASIEKCRWTGSAKPYKWNFEVKNETANAVSLTWTAFPYKKGYILRMGDHDVQHSTLKPHETASYETDASLECPNMRHGQSDDYAYFVVADDIRLAQTGAYARTGFFPWWNGEASRIADDDPEQETARERLMGDVFRGAGAGPRSY